MKTFINCIRYVFTSLVAIMLPLLGMFAALVSAIIEYSVIKDFLKMPIEGINQTAFAICVVLSLEGIKFVSYFFSAGLDRKNLQVKSIDPSVLKKYLTGLRRALVGISIFCSMVFFVNQFYFDSESMVQIAIREQEKSATDALKEQKTEYYTKLASEKGLTEMESLLENEKTHLTELQNTLSDIPDINNGNQFSMDVAFESTIEAIDRCEKKIDDLNTEISTLKTEINGVVDEHFQEDLIMLEEYASSAELLAAGDNPTLRTFLSAVTKTMTGKMYGRKLYMIITCLIGISISLLLEAIIGSSLKILNMDTDEISSIIGAFEEINRATKKFLQYWVRIATSTILSMATFLVIILFVKIPITKDMLSAITCTYLITVVLWNSVTIKSEINGSSSTDTNKVRKATTYANAFITEVIKWIAPNAISFVVFIVLGYFLNNSMEFDSIESLAVAVGGSFAHIKRGYYSIT